jgi:hypothetical protein
MSGLHQLGPGLKVAQLFFRLLGEQVVGYAHRELAIAVQFLDDPIVLRVILKSAAGVDHPGHAKAVHFPHEVPR